MPTSYNKRNTAQVNNTPVVGDSWAGNGLGGSTNNNHGVVRCGGNIAGTAFENAGNNGDTLDRRFNYVYNSSALPGSRKIVDKALSAGTFSYFAAGVYVMRKVSTTLAGQANTTLLTGASDFSVRRSIHKTEAWRTSQLVSATWTGSQASIESPGPNHPVFTFVYSNSLTSAYTQNSSATNPASQTGDISANPSLSVPGQLLFQTGSTVAYKALYSQKTQG